MRRHSKTEDKKMIPEAKDIKNFYYTMKLEDAEKFRINIYLPVKNKLLSYVLKLSFRNAVYNKKLEDMESFTIDKKYFKLIGQGLNKHIAEVSGIAKTKGVQIIDWKVINGEFNKEGKYWKCTLSITGEYARI